MRQIGTIPKDVDAKTLADHLLALGITTRLVEQPEGWAVWVHNEDRIPEASRELEAFLQAPTDPRFQDAAIKAHAVRREAQQADRRVSQALPRHERTLGRPSRAQVPAHGDADRDLHRRGPPDQPGP